MLKRILTTVFGKFESREEVKKYALLGLTFFVWIATYWALRPMKDSIFQNIVGAEYQPYAKMLSLVVVLLLIAVYGKLVDLLPRHKVFYLLTGIYAAGAFVFYFAFSDPISGLANTAESPYRLIGWLWYLYVESSATLLVPLFWAFSADVSTPSSAKRGFPLIMLCAQFGNIIGPWLLRAKRFGFDNSAPVVALIGIAFLLFGSLIWLFMHVMPASEFHISHQTKEEKSAKPGFLEGLKLIMQHRYLLGIFIFLLAYEAVQAIIDFFWKFEAKKAFPDEAVRAEYYADFAVLIGVLSFLFLLFGINNIQRKLGMRASLITLPILVASGVLVWRFNPTMSVAFWVLVIFKAINYALNQPSIKQLYMPTSKDARYKSQAWIEVFGSRGAKALGSGVNALKLPMNNLFGTVAGASIFLTVASFASLGLVGIWFVTTFFVSQQYNKAVKEDRVVC